MDIFFEDIIRQAAPELKVVTIEAKVKNKPTSEELHELIERSSSDIRNLCRIEEIKQRPAIAATRQAYKALGKEPNRYRPSAEALCRRIVKGMALYEINTLVDLINLVSILTGYSIGGFDMDKIEGERLTLGAGRKDEPFEGIGRGPLNIENLPLYRDGRGGHRDSDERQRADKARPRNSEIADVYQYLWRRDAYR